ncbi:GtrA family protein [Leisingera sp. S232]|uniref:GtrA family protein n=1 Tax=Leisingera sp. S232 TaxID=3415132 RepID=UPI00086F8143|nr:polysaccharide biosynthesis protein GtrA [Rhodobacteraceae bacterium (ex Bugula neritina AB1)]
MTRTALVLRYTVFAVLATFSNLAVQRLVLVVAGSTGAGFAAAVLCGTAAGLALKYILDKRWIFADTSRGLAAHGRKFTLYTAMGLITTAIFWGSETAFWLAWGTDAMRETGAVLGLAAGYAIKYQLDRRYVFNQAAAERPA